MMNKKNIDIDQEKMGAKFSSDTTPLLMSFSRSSRSSITFLGRIELCVYSGCLSTYSRIHWAKVSLLPLATSLMNFPIYLNNCFVLFSQGARQQVGLPSRVVSATYSVRVSWTKLSNPG